MSRVASLRHCFTLFVLTVVAILGGVVPAHTQQKTPNIERLVFACKP